MPCPKGYMQLDYRSLPRPKNLSIQSRDLSLSGYYFAPDRDSLTTTVVLALSSNPAASVTNNWNTSVPTSSPPTGAVKLGATAVGSDSVTGGPEICFHL